MPNDLCIFALNVRIAQFSTTSLELMIWLSGVAVGARRLSSLLELIGSSTSLLKSEEKWSFYCPLSIIILIPSVSLAVFTTHAFDIYPSRLWQSLICRFLLRKYVGRSLPLTNIVLSGGEVWKTKRFFFLVANLIIFSPCFNTICFE